MPLGIAAWRIAFLPLMVICRPIRAFPNGSANNHKRKKGDALAQSRRRSQARQEHGDSPIEIGISLHIGELAYGNVGLPRRLDFTVIGPSANVVTRLQELCKSLNTPIIPSAEFAGVCETGLVTLGEQNLCGVEGRVTVFTLPELSGD